MFKYKEHFPSEGAIYYKAEQVHLKDMFEKKSVNSAV